MTQQRAEYPLDYTKSAVEQARESASDMADTAAQKVTDAAANAQELAGKVATQAQDAARNFKPFVEKSLKEQPMTTLAVAAAVGLVLGALWKR